MTRRAASGRARRRPVNRRHKTTRPLLLEPLEDRRLLTAYTLPLNGGQETFQWFDLVSGSDFDTLAMTVPASSRSGHAIRIEFDPAFADLDLYLIDSIGNQWSSVSPINNGVEQISLAGLAPGPFTATVGVRALFPSSTAFYRVLTDTPFAIVPDAIDQTTTNNIPATATSLNSAQGVLQGPVTVSGNIHFHPATGPDIDWYWFRSVASGTDQSGALLDFDHSQGDLDLWLYHASDLNTPIASSTTTSNDELLAFHRLLPGDYFLAVAGKSPGGSLRHTNPAYSLVVSLPFAPVPDGLEPNHSTSLATNVGLVNALLTIPGNSIHASGNDDFFAFQIGSTGTSSHGLILGHSQTLGDLNIAVLDAAGQPIRWSGGSSDTKTVSLENLPAGNYFAQVYGNGHTNPDYTITFVTPIAPDILEFDSVAQNDSIAFPTYLGGLQGSGGLSNLTVHVANNDDWFQFQTLNTGTASDFVRIDFDNGAGDLGIAVYDAQGNLLTFQNQLTADFDVVSFQGAPPAVYYVQVYGNGNTNPNYTLSYQFPAPPPADALEPNDNWGIRRNLGLISGLAEYPGLSLHLPGDQDWFEFQIDAQGASGNHVRVDFDAYQGNVDLALYDVGGTPLAWSFGYENREQVSLTGLAPGTYYLWVGSQFGNPTPNYRLTIDAPLAATPDFTEGGSIPWDLQLREGVSRVDNLSIHAADDIDWFQFEITATGGPRHHVQIEHTAQRGRLDAVLFNAQGVYLDQASAGGSRDQVALDGLAPGIYLLGVFGSAGATNPQYALRFDAPGGAAPADHFESNNTSATATNLDVLRGLRAWADPELPLSIHVGSDRDWYRFELTETASEGHAAGILFDAQRGDLDLSLYAEENGQAGTLLSTATGTANTEEVSLAGLAAGVYYLLVEGYQGATNPEYALITNAPGADRFEANDTRATATNLSSRLVAEDGSELPAAVRGRKTWQGLSIDDSQAAGSSGPDEDWYQIDLAADAGLGHFVQIAFRHALGNLNLELYDASGGLLNRSQSVSDNEQVSLEGLTVAGGPYYVRVVGFEGDSHPLYTLSVNAPEPLISDRYEANDTRSTASDLGLVRGLYTISDTDHPLSIDTAGDEDWFQLEIGEGSHNAHFVGIYFEHLRGDLDLELYDSGGTLIERAAGVGDIHYVSLAGLQAGDYYARVVGFNGAVNPRYGLAVNAPGANTPDWSEPNNQLSSAHDLGRIESRVILDGLSIHDDSDVDVFTFELGSAGQTGHGVTLASDPFQGDIDLTLIDSNGNRWESATAGHNERLSLDGLPAGTYQIVVDGEANPRYSLAILGPGGPGGDFAEQHNGTSNNDRLADAFDLRTVVGPQVLEGLSIHSASDQDWYRFELGSGLTASEGDFVAIVFDPTLGDLDIQLLDAAGNVLLDPAGNPRESATAEGIERISLAGLAQSDGPFFLRVVGHRQATNPYYSVILQTPDSVLHPDWAENNNLASSAHSLHTLEGFNAWNGLSLHNDADEDWFQFDLPAGTQGVDGHSIEILFNHAEGNLDLELYRADDLNTPLGVSANISNREQVSLEGLSADEGPWLVRVTGDPQPGYQLRVNAPKTAVGDWAETLGGSADNDLLQRAVDLREVEGSIALRQLSIDPAGDEDYFRFVTTAAAGSGQFVAIDFQATEGDLTLELLDAGGQLLASSATGLSTERIGLEGRAAGTYYVRIREATGGTNPAYNLTIVAPGKAGRDFAESNDSPHDAFDLRDLAQAVASARSRFAGQTRGLLGDLFIPPGGSVADIPAFGASSSSLSSAFLNPLQVIGNLAAATQAGVNNPLGIASQPLSIPGLDPAFQPSLNLINQFSSDLSNIGTIGGSALSAINPSSNSAFNPAFNQLAQTGYLGINPHATSASLFGSGNLGFGSVLANLNPLGAVGGGLGALSGFNSFGGGGFNTFGGLGSLGGFQPFHSFGGNSFSNLLAGTGLIGGGSPAFNFLSGIGALSGVRSGGGLQQAVAIGGLSLHASDVDWYRFELSDDPNQDQLVRLLFDDQPGSLELRLYSDQILDDPTSPPLEVARTAGQQIEISLADLAAGTYYLQVSGPEHPSYALEINAAPPTPANGDWAEDNNQLSEAQDLRAIEGVAVYDGLTIHQDGDEDWFRFETRADAVAGHVLRIDFQHFLGDLELALYDSGGGQIALSDSTDNRESISLAGLPAGTYYAQVYAYDGAAAGDYVLSLSTPEVTIEPDRFEPNNVRTTATDLNTYHGVDHLDGLTLHAGDEDYFRFTTRAVGSAAHRVAIDFEHDAGDLLLELYNAAGQLIGQSQGTRNHEVVSLLDLPAGDYSVRVVGATPTTTNRYRLTLDVPAVTAATPELDAWTIMVYMTAGDLEAFAFQDLNEMEEAAAALPGSVNIVVLLDQTDGVVRDQQGGTRPGIKFATGSDAPWGDVGRAIIIGDQNANFVSTEFERLGEQNTGDPLTLVNFVEWAVAAAPAERYALVMWDHGNGLVGFNTDVESGDHLTNPELTAALDDLSATVNFDVLSFDACMMAMAEVANAAAQHATLLVASEENEGAAGYNYATAFRSLLSQPGQVSPEQFADGLVESYRLQYGNTGTFADTHSAIDLRQLTLLNTALRTFTDVTLSTASASDWVQIRLAIAGVNVYGSQNGFSRDLGQFMAKVAERVANPTIAARARDVVTTLDQVVLFQTQDRRRSLGLAIFLPLPWQGLQYQQMLPNYQANNGAFVAATRWDAFLDAYTGGTFARNLHPDFAGLNQTPARAFNLRGLSGDQHTFDGLRLAAGEDDWHRFSIHATATASDAVTIQYDPADGPLRLSLYSASDPSTPLASSQDGNGVETISLNGLVQGEYLLKVTQIDEEAAPYRLLVDAPANSLGDDWIRGNDRPEKAHDLGVIASDSLFSGLVVQSPTEDWFRFETPRLEAATLRQIQILPAGGDTLTVELFDEAGESLATSSSSSEAVLQYVSGAGETYRFKVTTASASPAPYVVQLVMDPVNEVATAIHLSSSQLAENSDGAVVGTLTTSDAEDDPHSYEVSDARFEVIGQQLKLRDGQQLDHEAESSISLQVTATDINRHDLQVSANFTITVTDINEAPTELTLDNTTVDERVDGAPVGTLTVTDPDGDTQFQFTVSDSRFEIAGQLLKLKATAQLQAATEPAVTLQVTASDSSDPSLQVTRTFQIDVIADGPLWQNPQLRQDVTNDGAVLPVDVLAVVNYINREGSGPVPTDGTAPPPYYDVSGDDQISPVDVVAVINYINGALGGEGEPAELAMRADLTPSLPSTAIDSPADSPFAIGLDVGPDWGPDAGQHLQTARSRLSSSRVSVLTERPTAEAELQHPQRAPQPLSLRAVRGAAIADCEAFDMDANSLSADEIAARDRLLANWDDLEDGDDLEDWEELVKRQRPTARNTL